MGIMKVIKEAHQDPTTDDTRWVSVTFEPVETLKKPLFLKEIRLVSELTGLPLLKQPRLAVMKLTESEFNIITRWWEYRREKY